MGPAFVILFWLIAGAIFALICGSLLAIFFYGRYWKKRWLQWFAGIPSPEFSQIAPNIAKQSIDTVFDGAPDCGGQTQRSARNATNSSAKAKAPPTNSTRNAKSSFTTRKLKPLTTHSRAPSDSA